MQRKNLGKSARKLKMKKESKLFGAVGLRPVFFSLPPSFLLAFLALLGCSREV